MKSVAERNDRVTINRCKFSPYRSFFPSLRSFFLTNGSFFSESCRVCEDFRSPHPIVFGLRDARRELSAEPEPESQIQEVDQ